MKGKSWLWWFWVFAGSLVMGGGIRYFISGQAAQNTTLWNALVVGQILLGIAIIAFGLKKLWRSRGTIAAQADDSLKLTED